MAKDKPKDSVAAAKVFSIAELLEAILLNLRGDTTPSSLPDGAAEPIVQLFDLRRTNLTFRGVINNSTGLKKLMFLTPPGGNIKEEHAPIHWLMRRLGNEDGENNVITTRTPALKIAEVGEVDVRDDDVHAALQRFLRHDHPQASWRQIKFIARTARIVVTYAKPPNMDETSYHIVCEFPKLTTLGQLFDKYNGLLHMTMEQHKQADESPNRNILPDARGAVCRS